ncbi:DUF6691 family protein [Vibrio sp. E150_011]|uniref:DUF6691 family protein n=1 Tax=Vibrio sp. 10N.261.51.F12 TaxID=3229679 RepID=UPI00354FFA79
MYLVIALISGVLFGVGMIVSGMSDPLNVIGFLDVFGHWKPDLAFVMGGALLVFAPSYWFIIKRKQKPVCQDEFCVPTNTKVDKKLIIGATLFGIGWGIAGICPGPAIASIANGSWGIVGFVVTMLLGLSIGGKLSGR